MILGIASTHANCCTVYCNYFINIAPTECHEDQDDAERFHVIAVYIYKMCKFHV